MRRGVVAILAPLLAAALAVQALDQPVRVRIDSGAIVGRALGGLESFKGLLEQLKQALE